MNYQAILFMGLLLAGGCSTADQTTTKVPFDPVYSNYGMVLDAYVDAERFDYVALKANRAALDSFVNQLTTISTEELARMTRDEQMAFWINAYNGLTLRSIIDHYPVKSIKDIDDVWDKTKWLVAGRKVTLDEIEHKILRPDFADARLHFAVNCASVGCPPLADKPYMGITLNAQLDGMARAFVNHPKRTVVDLTTGVITTSELFSWFGEDFLPAYGGHREFDYLKPVEAAIMQFIFAHAESDRLKILTSHDKWRLKYRSYDWSLNIIEK